MMGVTRATTTALTVAALTVLGLSAGPAQARDLRLADNHAPGSPTVEAIDYMNKVVRERTAGRQSIEVRQADRDSENFTVASLRNGMLDMARINLAVLNSLVPTTVVPTLPYLFKSTAHMRRTLDGPIGEEILGNMSSVGVVGLCFYDSGVHSFYSGSRSIRRASDMRGLMVRVQPASLSVAIVRALGATPVPMPADRVHDALKRGVIDAAEDNWSAYIASGHFNVAKHYSLTRHSMVPGVLVVSKIVWDQLPAPDRAVIRAAAKESVSLLRTAFDASEAEARQKGERAGVEVIEDVDGKSFAEALSPLNRALLVDAKLQNMVMRIRADDEVAHKP
jgi:tripartite ATP-independent transporter DctP family solute receptor